MDKLLKLEKYQLLHNSIYWCGMIGIFILGFFTADTYVTEVMGPTEEIVSSLADIFNGKAAADFQGYFSGEYTFDQMVDQLKADFVELKK